MIHRFATPIKKNHINYATLWINGLAYSTTSSIYRRSGACSVPSSPISKSPSHWTNWRAPWDIPHNARLLRNSTGKSPFAYIRSLRLSKAAMCLRDGGYRIIDVPFDFILVSHEGFTRAFSRSFGLSPLDYRQRTPPIPLFMPHLVHDLIPTKEENAHRANPFKPHSFRSLSARHAICRSDEAKPIQGTSHIARRWASTYEPCSAV